MSRNATTWGVLLLLAAPAIALDSAGAPVSVTLLVGRGTVVDCPTGVSRISTSNPEAVDAVVAGESEVLFQAKAVGQATLMVWSKSGVRKTYEVTVEPNLEPLRALLKETFPDEEVDLRASRESLALIGRVSTQAIADKALALVTASVKGGSPN
jgi:pilus assembly protein CpaC